MSRSANCGYKKYEHDLGVSVRMPVESPFAELALGAALFLALGLSLLALGGCGRDSSARPKGELPVFTYEVAHAWPHQRDAFTQGLVFLDGALLESTGLNGRSSLRRVDLQTGDVLQRAEVSPEYFAEGLEYVKGEIYANVWGTDQVVRIDPATGEVASVIDFAGLLPRRDRDKNADVLNGIAYDPEGQRLFITGKCWPTLFEVRLKPK